MGTQRAAPLIMPPQPIDFLTAPFKRFARMEASGGILLLLCTMAALICANSSWAGMYHDFWERGLAIGLGSISVTLTGHEWINDGLMAIFFFLMGLEIKREVMIGELSSLKSAAFPFLAALGGSLIPMGIYLALAPGSQVQRGWAIPMATDIAFALGVLALLGKDVPAALKVFVTALAIVDDVFAVLVIAWFYTGGISALGLSVTVLGLAASCLANWLGIRRPAVYAVIGVFVWFAVLQSGIHATIAGVLMALTIPASTLASRSRFLHSGRFLLNEIERSQPHSAEEHDACRALERKSELMQSPLHRIEHRIQPWVSFVIMPLFALANAGVHLGKMAGGLANPVMLAVALGLLLGKPVGITSFAWLAAKLGIASPPVRVRWSQIFGASCLCGIGFTMALFIASLAFGEGELLSMAKIGIFSASFAGCGCRRCVVEARISQDSGRLIAN